MAAWRDEAVSAKPAGDHPHLSDRLATALRPDRRERLRAERPHERVAQQGMLGLGQLGIGRHELLGIGPRPLEQRSVAR